MDSLWLYMGSLHVLVSYIIVKCAEADEFGQYWVDDLFPLADCSVFIHLSTEDDWKYGGQVRYDPAHKAGCQQHKIKILADYELNYKIQFYWEENKNSSVTGSNDKIELDAYHDNANGTDEICSQCRVDGFLYTSPSNNVAFTFTDQNRGWTLTFVLYRKAVLCNSYEYACADNRCIFHSLNCNGNNPCGDHTDCLISYPAMAAIAFGGFCVLGVVFSMLFIFIRSRKTSIWHSRDKQPRKFSPAKALLSIQSFAPVAVAVTPMRRRWSYKY